MERFKLVCGWRWNKQRSRSARRFWYWPLCRGWFTTAGGVPANRVARWNGSSWSPLGIGTDSLVNILAVSGTDVFAGGYFTTAGCHAASNFSRYSLDFVKKAPFDYDGDGKSDISVWRPSDGVWYIIQSQSSSVRAQGWGLAGDKLTPADFDGDGKDGSCCLQAVGLELVHLQLRDEYCK
jgi:hypothetical protein